MIDLKQLRDDPNRFRVGCERKNIRVDLDRLLALDARRRAAQTVMEQARAEQNRLGKETGPQIGRLSALLRPGQALRGQSRLRAQDPPGVG